MKSTIQSFCFAQLCTVEAFGISAVKLLIYGNIVENYTAIKDEAFWRHFYICYFLH